MGIKNNGSHCQSHFSYIHKLPISLGKVGSWLAGDFLFRRQRANREWRDAGQREASAGGGGQ